jgi:hypothetical protein
MRIRKPSRHRAFTLVDGLVMVFLVGLIFFLVMPLFLSEPVPSRMINCVNNLKQDGLAFRIWAGDHGEKFPMNVSTTQGGVQELAATGNVAACFQVISNILTTPKILVCPSDTGREIATNFGPGFSRANISYFVGPDVFKDQTNTVLSGDANLTINGRPIPSSGDLNLWSNTADWTTNRHRGKGVVLLPDGSVRVTKQIGSALSKDSFFATNRVIIP